MRGQLLPLSISFCSMLTTFFLSSSPSFAQCIQSDMSLQYRANGATEPTRRSNEVDMESSPSCTGNTSVTFGEQGIVGGQDRGQQHRRVNHTHNGEANETGVNAPTIQHRTNVGIDVYNPAGDGENL